jgi:uncharacterized repeat protein (TIGR03803 family)
MKTCIKKSFLVLTVAFGSVLNSQVSAQAFKTLHNFTAVSGLVPVNTDGGSPSSRLIINSSGDALYGTAGIGGSSGNGTVFKINADGTGFTVLINFNNEGSGGGPAGGLILANDKLYGTFHGAGNFGRSGNNDTVFAVNTDGTGLTNLHIFTNGLGSFPLIINSDGEIPVDLILSGNTLYGTAFTGGDSGYGTVFGVRTDGTSFTTLHTFTSTNSDGAYPEAGLILSDNTLIGTTYAGGGSGNGTVFAINTDGTGFTNLHDFTAGSTNSDGANPASRLILLGNTLYGTTLNGGSSGGGTVFALNTDGTGFTNLYNFRALSTNSLGLYTNGDGAGPLAGLILSGNTLYGTAASGGSSGVGTVFAVHTDGTGFTNLHNFMARSGPLGTNSDGAYPEAGLILSDNTLYGTASEGGSSGVGTVFSLSFQPQLSITPSLANIILTWPSNYAGFDYSGYQLQSTTNLSSSVWTTNLPAPVIVNGQYTFTNTVSGVQQFFRLVQ